MNGIKYLLDTNALISFLQGNPKLIELTSRTSLGIFIISVLEFLSFTGIKEPDKKLFLDFISKIDVTELASDNLQLLDIITDIRANFKVKLPDAIIAGTAIYKNAVLITNDKDFAKIYTLKIRDFN